MKTCPAVLWKLWVWYLWNLVQFSSQVSPIDERGKLSVTYIWCIIMKQGYDNDNKRSCLERDNFERHSRHWYLFRSFWNCKEDILKDILFHNWVLISLPGRNGLLSCFPLSLASLAVRFFFFHCLLEHTDSGHLGMYRPHRLSRILSAW